MASSELSDIFDESVQHWLANHVRDVLISDAKLATFVLAPGIHLAKLIDRQSVGITTTDFFDQLVF